MFNILQLITFLDGNQVIWLSLEIPYQIIKLSIGYQKINN
jgi:hypothetical protein